LLFIRILLWHIKKQDIQLIIYIHNRKMFNIMRTPNTKINVWLFFTLEAEFTSFQEYIKKILWRKFLLEKKYKKEKTELNID